MPKRSRRDSSEEYSASEEEDEYLDDIEDEQSAEAAEASLTHGSRLSRFKKPKLSDRGKYNLTSQLGKAKGTRKGRNFGKLAQLINMPLDVFFEITAQLRPLDILNLSRVSKHFRSMFASRNSRHIWVAARRNLGDMPDCPPDMSEPQYASLMFEHHCQACGVGRAHKTDYALRLRFCSSCFKENVQKGSTLLKPYRKVPDSVLQLLPRSMIKSPGVYKSGRRAPGVGNTFDIKDNGRSNTYYVPELEMVVKRYQQLKSDEEALQSFTEKQGALASQMMKDASILLNWTYSNKNKQGQEEIERMDNREASVEAKLLELGWERKYFGSTWDHDWSQLVRQPRELTPRIWKVIQPKLEALMRRNQRNQEQRELESRRRYRCHEFYPIWRGVVQAIQDPIERSLMPDVDDACALPHIAEMLNEDEARIPVTEERWLAIVDTLPDALAHYQKKVKRHVVERLINMAPSHWYNPYNNVPDISNDCTDYDDDFHLLDKAKSVFVCSSSEYTLCNAVLTYPTLLSHEHLVGLPLKRAMAMLSRTPEVEAATAVLLKTLGLPEDASRKTLDEMNGRLQCLCGHPKSSKPMDANELIRHIADEQAWFNRMITTRKQVKRTKNLQLVNDHKGTDFVTVLPKDNATPSVRADEDTLALFGSGVYCTLCYMLSVCKVELESKAEAIYHMAAKHKKEFADDDLMDNDALTQFQWDHPGFWS